MDDMVLGASIFGLAFVALVAWIAWGWRAVAGMVHRRRRRRMAFDRLFAERQPESDGDWLAANAERGRDFAAIRQVRR